MHVKRQSQEESTNHRIEMLHLLSKFQVSRATQLDIPPPPHTLERVYFGWYFRPTGDWDLESTGSFHPGRWGPRQNHSAHKNSPTCRLLPKEQEKAAQ